MSKVGGSTNFWPICLEMKVINAAWKKLRPTHVSKDDFRRLKNYGLLGFLKLISFLTNSHMVRLEAAQSLQAVNTHGPDEANLLQGSQLPKRNKKHRQMSGWSIHDG